MKTKSTMLTVATAALGLAFIAPLADARPPSKSHAIPKIQKQPACPVQACPSAKTVGLMTQAAKPGPRFKRKLGGPAQVVRVDRSSGVTQNRSWTHFDRKVGGIGATHEH